MIEYPHWTPFMVKLYNMHSVAWETNLWGLLKGHIRDIYNIIYIYLLPLDNIQWYLWKVGNWSFPIYPGTLWPGAPSQDFTKPSALRDAAGPIMEWAQEIFGNVKRKAQGAMLGVEDVVGGGMGWLEEKFILGIAKSQRFAVRGLKVARRWIQKRRSKWWEMWWRMPSGGTVDPGVGSFCDGVVGSELSYFFGVNGWNKALRLQ